jgi:hypothetical protein
VLCELDHEGVGHPPEIGVTNSLGLGNQRDALHAPQWRTGECGFRASVVLGPPDCAERARFGSKRRIVSHSVFESFADIGERLGVRRESEG